MNEEIIGSLEEWDSIINYYRPNGSSKTWYLKELKKLEIPLMWGDWSLFKEGTDKEMFDISVIKSLVISYEGRDIVKFLPYDKVNNIKHLYIITIFDAMFFIKNKSLGFSCMSEKYKKDVREGRCKIILTLFHEGISGTRNNMDLEIIEKWRINENFPINSIYYFSGNLIIDKNIENKKLGIKAIPIQMFTAWIPYDENFTNSPPISFLPQNEKYLFLSYNRRPRAHRVFFVHELIKNNLLNDGLLSLNKPEYNIWNYSFPDMDNNVMEIIRTQSPFNIDVNINLDYNLAHSLEKKDYEQTFISIISETLTDFDDCLFLTEKIWKPIVIGHPFMVYGNIGTLKYLKQLGYKTFDTWIDESYDTENDYLERGRMIVNELLKLKQYDIDTLKKIREDMYLTCQFNKNHFFNLMKFNYDRYTSTIYKKHLTNIWKSIPDVPPVKIKLI